MANTDQTAAAINAASSGIAAAAGELGATLSAEQIAAIATFAVDAISGTAWRSAAAAGAAAAASITTEDEAEAEERKP